MTNNEDFNKDIDRAVEVLRQGGIILYPTDTIWGIGCDATNAEAVSRIYALKKRQDAKSMISLVDSAATLERWVETLPEAAEMLIDVAVRPMTIIYDHPKGVASNLLASDGSMGIRITTEYYSRQLCRRLRRPVVSTSANISGQPSPKNFQQISSEIIDGVDYVAPFGRDLEGDGRPSDIIKVSDSGVIKIIR